MAHSGKHALAAILVTAADTDDRVVPAHSFKYIAALRVAKLYDKPRILRVDKRTGHGAWKPTGKATDETADPWAFVANWAGLHSTMADWPLGGAIPHRQRGSAGRGDRRSSTGGVTTSPQHMED